MALRYAYGLHRDAYDLHRKFGSEMAAKGSQNIDGENPSLSANNLKLSAKRWAFFVQGRQELDPVRTCAEKLKGRKAVSFKSFARAPRRAGREKAREAWLIPHSGPVLRYLLKTHWNALSFK